MKGNFDWKKYLEKKPQERWIEYNIRDIIIYSVSIGSKDLKYVYELDNEFKINPTYLTVIPFNPSTPHEVVQFNKKNKDRFPGANLDPSKFLHGEEEIEILKPLKTSGKVKLTEKTIEILDKTSGTVVVSETLLTYNGESDPFAKIRMTSFIVGLTGHGAPNKSTLPIRHNVPKLTSKEADFILEEKIQENQAQLYRLNGDYNPLHIDPKVAKSVGFQVPILHGLCSFGVSTRLIIENVLNGNGDHIKLVKGRFTSPVLPGQTLRVHVWKVFPWIIFDVYVKETNKKNSW
eukprot:TRINITY_DN6451_c0_g1_i2.p1 TRINITY_DN6451_c0_g1~~TRINITY_DN6451_c0_g1_i2.p1  ORF type:complete len:327 (+),score=86.26 TRINITY_DN6451_c0_g1_i2:114-983(+)